jgi:hypothetical protein
MKMKASRIALLRNAQLSRKPTQRWQLQQLSKAYGSISESGQLAL